LSGTGHYPFDGKTAEGKIYRKEPGKWFGDIPYTYSATFRATVPDVVLSKFHFVRKA
jgi:hypothetical protein